MQEIEVKIFNINKTALRRKLKALGAKQTIKPVLVKEIAFRRKAAPHTEQFLLRLRSVGKTIELAFKKSLSKKTDRFKVEQELQVIVDDFEAMRGILESVGFQIFRRREKIREEFKVAGCKVEIDTHPGCNPYMEIEGSKNGITSLIKKLGYSLSDASNETGSEVLRRLGKNPNYLVFKK